MKKLRITVDGKTYDVTVQVLEDDEREVNGAGFLSPLPPAPRPAPASPAPPGAGTPMPKGDPNAILAPLAGTVQKVFVEKGARVDAKAPVVLLDAMKMDTYIYAPRGGRVAAVEVAPGDSVQVGDRLIRYEPEA
jgi:glutaconyl-CoA/methylmalonyl-CoA decarboxylase subunit gamma